MSGGLYRRALAWMIDAVVVLAACALLSPVLFAASGGVLNQAQVWSSPRCDSRAQAPAWMVADAGFIPDRVRDCTHAIFGLPSGRYLVLSAGPEGRDKRGGREHAMARQWAAFPLDSDGDAGRALRIGWRIDGLVIAVVVMLSEAAFGTSIGKAILALRVRSVRGRRAGLFSVVLRNGLLYGGWLLAGGMAIADYLDGHGGSPTQPHAPIDIVVIGWLCVAGLGFLLVRPGALHDRLSGTRVEAVEDSRRYRFTAAIAEIFASATTWSLVQRAAAADLRAAELLDRLREAALKLGLVGDDWLRPYAVGFLWRHIAAGQEMAYSDDALRRFRGAYPYEAELRRISEKMAPVLVELGGEALRVRMTSLHEPSENADPAFVKGCAEADRILHWMRGTGRINDDHTNKIVALERRLNRAGRELRRPKGLARLLIAPPGETYAYLVARTLGETAFRLDAPDDALIPTLAGLSVKSW